MEMKIKEKEFPSLVEFGGEDSVYQCPYCSRAPKGFDNLKLHMTLAHNTKRILSCTHCSYQTLVEQNLINHKNEIHPNLSKHTCFKCNFQTWDVEKFSRHKCQVPRTPQLAHSPENFKHTSNPKNEPPNPSVAKANQKLDKKEMKIDDRSIRKFSHAPSNFSKIDKKAARDDSSPAYKEDHTSSVEQSADDRNVSIPQDYATPENSIHPFSSTPVHQFPFKNDHRNFYVPKVTNINGKIKIRLKAHVNSAVISAIINKAQDHGDSKVRKRIIDENTSNVSESLIISEINDNGEKPAKAANLSYSPSGIASPNANTTNSSDVIYTCDHCPYITPKLAGKIMRDSLVTLGLTVHVRKTHGDTFNNQDKKMVENLFCVTKNIGSNTLSIWKVRKERVFAVVSRISEAQKVLVPNLIELVNSIIGVMHGMDVNTSEDNVGYKDEVLQRMIFVLRNSVTKEKEYFQVSQNINSSVLAMLKDTPMTTVNKNYLHIFLKDMTVQTEYSKEISRSSNEIIAQ